MMSVPITPPILQKVTIRKAGAAAAAPAKS
jgi:hypothetical protein